MKKNDELQLSFEVGELKLSLKDKEFQLRELEHAANLREKDLTL